jgi:hypothetical protein
MSLLRKLLIAPACLLTLAGCLDNVSVQNRYNQERDQCRGEAEERFNEALGDSADGLGDRARNTELATLFSKCMSSRGWTVATPNRGKKVADAQPFPGQTTPPPVNAATVAPVPVPLMMPPGYVPYGAAPPGYSPMTAPPPGAVMMAPQPVPGMVAPPPMAQPYSHTMPPASEPVPQPAPRPTSSVRPPRAQRAPLPSGNNAQDVLDRQLISPTARP